MDIELRPRTMNTTLEMQTEEVKLREIPGRSGDTNRITSISESDAMGSESWRSYVVRTLGFSEGISGVEKRGGGGGEGVNGYEYADEESGYGSGYGYEEGEFMPREGARRRYYGYNHGENVDASQPLPPELESIQILPEDPRHIVSDPDLFILRRWSRDKPLGEVEPKAKKRMFRLADIGCALEAFWLGFVCPVIVTQAPSILGLTVSADLGNTPKIR